MIAWGCQILPGSGIQGYVYNECLKVRGGRSYQERNPAEGHLKTKAAFGGRQHHLPLDAALLSLAEDEVHHSQGTGIPVRS